MTQPNINKFVQSLFDIKVQSVVLVLLAVLFFFTEKSVSGNFLISVILTVAIGAWGLVDLKKDSGQIAVISCIFFVFTYFFSYILAGGNRPITALLSIVATFYLFNWKKNNIQANLVIAFVSSLILAEGLLILSFFPIEPKGSALLITMLFWFLSELFITRKVIGLLIVFILVFGLFLIGFSNPSAL